MSSRVLGLSRVQTRQAWSEPGSPGRLLWRLLFGGGEL